MDKRTLFAVVLAVLVMFSFSFVVQKMYPTPKDQAAPLTSNQGTVSQTVSQPIVDHGLPAEALKIPISDIRKISTESVDYIFSDIGGCLKSIVIKKYNGKEQRTSELVYESEFLQNAIFSISGVTEKRDLTNAQYAFSKTQDTVEYKLIYKNEFEVRKIYHIKDNYGLVLELQINNISNAPLIGKYSLVGVSDIKSSTLNDARFAETIISVNGKQKKIKGVSQNKENNTYFGNIDWISMQSRYFSLALKPYQPTVSLTVSKFFNSNITLTLQSEDFNIPANSTISHKFLLYSGPSNPAIMSLHQAGIENSISLGIFGDISKLLLYTLKFFYRTSHSYGFAIILLAVLISLLLYPLTMKSIKSMKEMQLLQPKMDKLRKEHKDSPQKLNKEMLELYKKHKVNPFGGCLPMLLQMPIFIALYQALNKAIELKNAHFLWIKDLSSPDNAFFLPGTSFSINILPILMAITMFFQQKLSVSSNDAVIDKNDPIQQQQKMMVVLMPILFGFIFYNMPSGLVLYWFINTIVMFFQQISVMKQFHVERAEA